MAAVTPDASQKCQGCHKSLALTEFPLRQRGNNTGQERTKRCLRCTSNRAAGKENQPIPKLRDDGGLPLEDFEPMLSALGSLDHGSIDMEARVSFPRDFWTQCANFGRDGGDEQISDEKWKSKVIAERVSSVLEYRFIYHKKSPSRRKQGLTVYRYHCAQSKSRAHKVKKVENTEKQRDKLSMSFFECDGWLKITFDERCEEALITITHQEDHVPYCCIDIPKEVRALVIDGSKQRAVSDIWEEVLKRYPKPVFTRKAVYALWHQHYSTQFRLAKDEVESARKVLEEAKKGKLGLYTVEQITLPQEDGFQGIAWSLPEILGQWGSRIREISLDSTWKTNGQRFELYALLGESYGSGLPLSFLLLRSQDGAPGGKQRYIEKILKFLQEKWDLKPIFTLSDKDLSEINALRSQFPDAKHQLCFWHALRAVKTRLAILRRAPAFYNVDEARAEFNFIDKLFIPIGQSPIPIDPALLYVPPKAIPRITISLGGVIQRVEVPPPLTIRVPVLNMAGNPEEAGSSSDSDSEDYDEDDIDAVIEADATDQEDGPDWMFEEGEMSVASKDYVFCPAEHRKGALRLFTKHFCQHPLFPDRDGTSTAREIRYRAVHEMYTYCHQRGLRELWGYMWSSWYTSRRWQLWARSTSPRISRLRTTMNVERFWGILKNDWLYKLTHPRLDQLVWIIVTKVTPAYVARAMTLDDTFRPGRAKALTPYQAAFKKAWQTLRVKPVSDRAYNTNVARWQCNCGAQKYQAHHLCKHLVRAVPDPPPQFWVQVIRRRTVPLYQHPVLRAIDVSDETEEVAKAAIEDGTISDGDDHVFAGDRAFWGGNGEWRELKSMDQVLSKRKRSSEPMSDVVETYEIDPPSSDPVSYTEIEEETLEERAAKRLRLKELGEKLIQAGNIMIGQVNIPDNDIWIESVLRRHGGKGLGHDVLEMVDDIRIFEETGRVRRTTWATNRSDPHFHKNTMGYQTPL